MATNTRDFHLRFIANMDLGTFKKSLDSMQGSIEKLKITGSLKNEFDTLFKNLTKELNNFTTLTNQEFNSLSDVKKLESSQKTILSLYNTLQGKINQINTTKLNPIFTDEQKQRLEEINKILEENRKKVESANSSYATLRQQVSGIDFGDIEDARVTVYDKKGNSISTYNLVDDYRGYNGIIVGKVYYDGSEWKFEAIGDGENVSKLIDFKRYL